MAVTAPAVGTAPAAVPADPLDAPALWDLVDQHVASAAGADTAALADRARLLHERELKLDDEADDMYMAKMDLQDEAIRLRAWERRLSAREQSLIGKPRSDLGAGRRVR